MAEAMALAFLKSGKTDARPLHGGPLFATFGAMSAVGVAAELQ
jgi:hypothetical protein